MVKPEDVAERVPEMDEVKLEQEKVIDELLATVKEGNNGSYPFLFAREEDDPARRDLAYKFLKARRWKLKDALAMVNNTLAFRKEHGLDSWRLFPCAFPLLGYDEEDMLKTIGPIPGAVTPLDGRPMPTQWDMCYRALQSSYVNVYHYWDKEGHPVLYDCCGKASVSGILSRLEKATPVGKSLSDVIVPYHTYMNEVQYYIIRYANAKAKAGAPLGRPAGEPSKNLEVGGTGDVTTEALKEAKKIMGITVVLNAEGMHMGLLQKRFIQIVREIFAVDQSYYPEVLHRLFVINCPPLVQTAYSFVKSALDENTRKKLVFCSKSESLDVLRRVIDEERIPQELGGGCRCKGGCLPTYRDPEDDPNGRTLTSGDTGAAELGGEVEAPTEHLTIKAGKQLTRKIFLRAGEEISWQFALEGADVHFSADFEASGQQVDRASGPTTLSNGSVLTDQDSAPTPSRPPHTPSATSSAPTAASDDFVSPVSAGSPVAPSATGDQKPTSPPSTAKTAPPAKTAKGGKDKNEGEERHKAKKSAKSKHHQDPSSAGDGAGPVVVKKDTKLSADTASFKAEEDGVLRLLWDNGSSWMTSKKLQLRLFNGPVKK